MSCWSRRKPPFLVVLAGVLGEAEYSLPDDVLHDFVGAARDARAGDAEDELRPRVRAPFAAVGDELDAEHVAEQALHALHVGRHGQLTDRHLWSGQLTGLDLVA